MFDSNGIMITGEKVNGEQLKQYIQWKYNWSKIEQSLIDWDSLQKALKKYTEFRKLKMTQLMSNWQHDWQQKNTFNPLAQTECCSKCGELEDHNHYLEYRNEDIMKITRALKQQFTL